MANPNPPWKTGFSGENSFSISIIATNRRLPLKSRVSDQGDVGSAKIDKKRRMGVEKPELEP
jgi:hypothetical protein